VETEHPTLSIRRQCELLDLPRSTFYYELAEPDPEDLVLMRLLDEQYLRTPFYGSRKMVVHLDMLGHRVNRKRVQRLMRQMGLRAVYPRPKTSTPNPEHQVFPYLLRDMQVERAGQVFAADITYIPLRRGHVYLVAIIDWYSRYVVSWRLSTTLDSGFCVEALEASLEQATPEIFNTDQGSQFTSSAFVETLKAAGVRISMDGRGRALDNVFVERLWRSLKYEEIYLRSYDTVPDLLVGLARYFDFFNHERPHQALGYQTPAEVYFAASDPGDLRKSCGKGCGKLPSSPGPPTPRRASRLAQGSCAESTTAT
jgi:putative transposase